MSSLPSQFLAKRLGRAHPYERPILLRLGLAIAASAAVASSCLAEVIEIAEDGAATTHAAPAVFTDAGAIVIGSGRSALAPATQRIDVSRAIAEAAQRQGLNVDLVTEVAWRESRFRQDAVSNRDAVGIMQLTAGTARELGVNRYDAHQNIQGGAAYLRRMLDRYRGDVRLALAAYNAGPGAVDRYGGIPPYRETTAYVANIVSRLAQRQPNATLALFTAP